MRKSEPFNKPTNGNTAKFESYREAWTRINGATESGFYIEATTLLEAVASDRLLSFLFYKTGEDCSKKYRNFKDLLTAVEGHAHLCAKSDELQQVCRELQLWRMKRNNIVHGIVKSNPMTAPEPIDNFLQSAYDCAYNGQQLVRKVQSLTKLKTRAT